MAEELRLALAECEANTFEPQVQASNDAKSYFIAHRAAFEAYAHLQVYQDLAEVGEPPGPGTGPGAPLRAAPAVDHHRRPGGPARGLRVGLHQGNGQRSPGGR